MLGLNSEEIVHGGLTVEFLTDLDPDLVMLRCPGGYRPEGARRIVHEYMARNGFSLKAKIEKNPGEHYFCFVKDASPIGGEGVLIELVQAPPEVIEACRSLASD